MGAYCQRVSGLSLSNVIGCTIKTFGIGLRMDEFMKTVKAQLYERVASPLLFSFCISWIVWNYRLLLISFSSLAPLEKITYIDNFFEKSYFNFYDIKNFYIYCFVGPLVTSLIYIFIYPYPARFVYKYAINRQKEIKEIQQKIDDDTPLTIEEARQIRSESWRQSATHEEEMKRKDAQISALKSENSELNIHFANTQHILENTKNGAKNIGNKKEDKDNLSERQIQLLKVMSATNQIQKSSLVGFGFFPSINLDHEIDKLIFGNYIAARDVGTTGEDVIYTLASEGRRFLVENNMA